MGEVAVYRKPESLALDPQGKLWVVHQDDYAVRAWNWIPTASSSSAGFGCPAASQPVGVAMSPTGDAAYVSLMASGSCSSSTPGRVRCWARSTVESRSRAASPCRTTARRLRHPVRLAGYGGEMVKVDAASMRVATRIVVALDTTTVDGDRRERAGHAQLSVLDRPLARRPQASIPSKKNGQVLRGKLRDGKNLEPRHDHPTADRRHRRCETATEIYENRVDLDNRSMPNGTSSSVPTWQLRNPDPRVLEPRRGARRQPPRPRCSRQSRSVERVSAGLGARSNASPCSSRSSLSRDVLVYDLSALLKDLRRDGTPGWWAHNPRRRRRESAGAILARKKIFHDASDEPHG